MKHKAKQLVFIDDSGDPGFKLKQGSSKVFIIAFVIFNDYLEAEKVSLKIKELRRKLKVSDYYEFKFNKTDHKFRYEFINSTKNYKFKIRAIVCKKELIHSARLRLEKENFYNYMIMQALKNNDGKIQNAKLYFDKRGEKSIRNKLRVYLSHKLDNKNSKIFCDLRFVDSRQNTLIQLADMVAGSIYSESTEKNNIYLRMLQKAGRIEDLWRYK